MPVDESTIRRVRFPVWARRTDQNTDAFIRAHAAGISPSELHIIGVLAVDGSMVLKPGTLLVLRFVLCGEPDVFEVLGEVNNLEERFGGTVKVSLRFAHTEGSFVRALERFLRAARPRVLALDDDQATLIMLARMLQPGFEVLSASSPVEAWAHLEREDVAVLILDHCMPGSDGVAFLHELHQRYPARVISKIVYSAHLEAGVIEAYINAGKIFHYLRKPVGLAELYSVVEAAAETRALVVDNELLSSELLRANERLTDENVRLRAIVGDTNEFEHIVGRSKAMRNAMKMLWQVADYPTTVHIRGETGTGKELAARALHRASSRRGAPFLAFSCAGVPESLVQSVLFGHCKGAFTGAAGERKGLFEEGNGGTVLLDEVGELSPAAQTSLLRVLQEGEVVPLGATRPRPVDVRIISATHRDLRADVEAGRFRQDLYYRLVVFEIELPPLRQRPEDIVPLAEHFLARIRRRLAKPVSGFDAEALARLEAYRWPGNVREVQNEIERAVIRAPPGGIISVSRLSTAIRGTSPGSTLELGSYAGKPLREAMRDLEKRLIRHAMSTSNNVAASAAKKLGLDPSNLRKKLKAMGWSNDIER